MSSEHTPGPWTIVDRPEQTTQIEGPNSQQVAAVWATDFPDGVANAALIAAAPDMAEALRLLMRAEGMQRGERGGCIMGEISQAIDAARAALAKAQGVSL